MTERVNAVATVRFAIELRENPMHGTYLRFQYEDVSGFHNMPEKSAPVFLAPGDTLNFTHSLNLQLPEEWLDEVKVNGVPVREFLPANDTLPPLEGGDLD